MLDIKPVAGGWVLVLLLVHAGTTALLVRQLNAFTAVYTPAAHHEPWHLKLAAQVWSVLLLLLTYGWLLTDVALCLHGLLVAANHRANEPWF